MTKISTNDLDTVDISNLMIDDRVNPSELDAKDQRFYKAISPNLNLIQTLPKQETVFKIITYSRTKK